MKGTKMSPRRIRGLTRKSRFLPFDDPHSRESCSLHYYPKERRQAYARLGAESSQYMRLSKGNSASPLSPFRLWGQRLEEECGEGRRFTLVAETQGSDDYMFRQSRFPRQLTLESEMVRFSGSPRRLI